MSHSLIPYIVLFFKTRYLRIKRKNQTFFITTSPNQSISSIKRSLADALMDVVSIEEMNILKPPNVTLAVESLVGENELKEDDVLFLVCTSK